MIPPRTNDRTLSSRRRPELVSHRVSLDEMGSWVVQDPVTRKNFYLSEIEHDVLQMLARPISLPPACC